MECDPPKSRLYLQAAALHRLWRLLYLLDANVLIDAHRDYYPIGRIPEFWEWLIRMSDAGTVKIPREIYAEVSAGTDTVAQWASENTDTLLLKEEVSAVLVARVAVQGYAADLTDDEIEKLGEDPFLIAYALADANNRTVVSNEISRPSRQRANRHVPDVCESLGIRCINAFALIRELDFRTR